jgi:hypothetical protein
LAARFGKDRPLERQRGHDDWIRLLDDAVRNIRPALTLLLGAVSLLLIITCVNLSTLFGARPPRGRSEYAVRLALGASRARLVAQA